MRVLQSMILATDFQPTSNNAVRVAAHLGKAFGTRITALHVVEPNLPAVVICLVLGGIMLVDSPAGFIGVSLNLLIPISLATAAITFFLVGSIVRAQRGRVRTGGTAMIGAEAVAHFL